MGNGLWLMPESWHRSNRKPLVSLIFSDGAIQVLYSTVLVESPMIHKNFLTIQSVREKPITVSVIQILLNS